MLSIFIAFVFECISSVVVFQLYWNWAN